MYTAAYDEEKTAASLYAEENNLVDPEPGKIYPSGPEQARRLGVRIYLHNKTGELYRRASSKHGKSMRSYVEWKESQDNAGEIAHAQRFKHLVVHKSCHEIIEENLLWLLPIGSAAAREVGTRHFIRERGSCIHGHAPIGKLRGKKSVCAVCAKENKKAYPPSEKSREKQNKRLRDRRKANIKAFRARERLWRQNNRAKVKAKKLRYNKATENATPTWLTDEQWDEMNAIYARARRKTEETGIEYHVDHIVPLQGEEICGLHVPWNLRAVPAKINLKKSNKFVEC